MAPNVGYGLLASFTVKRHTTGEDNNTEIGDCLSYQWYRLDPENYENMILIPGATSLSYTTTTEDIGYRMLIRATGNTSEFNGFLQQKSLFIVH
jgi:hypothetical protein